MLAALPMACASARARVAAPVSCAAATMCGMRPRRAPQPPVMRRAELASAVCMARQPRRRGAAALGAVSDSNGDETRDSQAAATDAAAMDAAANAERPPAGIMLRAESDADLHWMQTGEHFSERPMQGVVRGLYEFLNSFSLDEILHAHANDAYLLLARLELALVLLVRSRGQQPPTSQQPRKRYRSRKGASA